MLIIEDLGLIKLKEGATRARRAAVFACSFCHAHITMSVDNVKRKGTSTCKSCSMSASRTTHGCRHNVLYGTWAAEKARCEDSNNLSYHNYGGRGICVSEEFQDIRIWLQYVESLPDFGTKGFTLDRIDNDGNYERGNLRWASWTTQQTNKRKRKSKSKICV